jgi:hypothetical protein
MYYPAFEVTIKNEENTSNSQTNQPSEWAEDEDAMKSAKQIII